MSLVTACLENLAAAFQSMNKAPQTFKISAALGKAFACGQVGGLISSVLQVERDCVEAAAQLGNPAIRDAEALPLKQGLRMKIAQKANRELKPQIEVLFCLCHSLSLSNRSPPCPLLIFREALLLFWRR